MAFTLLKQEFIQGEKSQIQVEFSLPTLSCVRFGGFGEGIGAADGTVPSLGLIFGITQNLENHGASSWLPALLKCRDAFAGILYFPTHFACIYHSPKGLEVKKSAFALEFSPGRA